MTKNSYVCPNCGFVLPKKDATVSGYDSQSSLRHVHCSRCGKIIDYGQLPTDKPLNKSESK